MKRAVINFAVVTIALLATITGCKKNEIDYNKLEGTTWVAEVDNIAFTLSFLDKHSCTILKIAKDETFSANLTTYFWRYRLDIDSAGGLFKIEPIDEEKGYFFFQWGFIENKKLCLHFTNNDDFNNLVEDDIRLMCFTRQ